MITKKAKRNRSGFTLIELLIVIGLLGALVALILPRLTADRREAMMDVGKYNKAGTLRTLHQYKELTGKYPNDMHSGLVAHGSGVTANRMPGMQKSLSFNVSDGTGNPAAKPASIQPLTATMVASLAAAGIERLCYDSGFNPRPLAEGDYVVMSCNTDGEQWLNRNFSPGVPQSGNPPKGRITINGRRLNEWVEDMRPAGGGNPGVIVVTWIAPTVDWRPGDGGNTDWTKGAVELGIAIEGKAPTPTENAEGGSDVSFGYNNAHFLVDNDDSDGIQPARLLDVMCGKPLNP